MSNKHSQEHLSQKIVRPRNATETRAALLAATRLRFARDGYEATNLRGIAADASASELLPYFQRILSVLLEDRESSPLTDK